MPNNESVEFYLRFVRQRYNVFTKALTQFLQDLTCEDRPKKLEAATSLLEALDALKHATSASDRPEWIGPLESILNWYSKMKLDSSEAGLIVLKKIIERYDATVSHKWTVEDASANSAIDFAAIYEGYYRGSRVPELFDELVAQLEKIIESGEIDSLQTIKALQKLIATIRKNARGDYFSTRGAWEFTQLFLKNLSIELFENIPGLKHAAKALRKTMSELDLEMMQVHDQVKQKLTETVSGDWPMLEYKALALPAPTAQADAKE